MGQLAGQKILLGVSGGIAAYKSAEIVRALVRDGAEVRVVMTRGATAFITPLTLQALSLHPVLSEHLDDNQDAAMAHIDLARWADLILIAPATAHLIAKMAQGFADDLLTTLYLATTAPVIIAPAMNQQMWQHPTTIRNCETLIQDGVTLLGPDSGEQACGEFGPGRMLEPEVIVEMLAASISKPVLANRHVLITAGPTQEAIDPVRFISNHSSGKMGYALAQAAQRAGATVTLVSGPTHLSCPAHVQCITVTTAQEMFNTVHHAIDEADIFIAAAAVTDYRPTTSAVLKIKSQAEQNTIDCTKNPDILASVGYLPNKPFVVGFAAETDNLLDNAKLKLEQKNCDLLIANAVGGNESAFASDHNTVTIISKEQTWEWQRMHKNVLAKQLIQLIAQQNHS